MTRLKLLPGGSYEIVTDKKEIYVSKESATDFVVDIFKSRIPDANEAYVASVEVNSKAELIKVLSAYKVSHKVIAKVAA